VSASVSSCIADARVCAICRRALTGDDRVVDIHGVRVHVVCATYRRRLGLRPGGGLNPSAT
jgi:hypothetical protein